VKRVLFVCTGNTCRSPMAEALLRARMPEAWRDRIEVSSAGTIALDGQPASGTAIDVMADIGIDLSGHRARRLTEELVREADLIVAMAEEHAQAIRRMVPEADKRILLLGELDHNGGNLDIGDPIGGDIDLYTRSRSKIEGLIQKLIEYTKEIFKF